MNVTEPNPSKDGAYTGRRRAMRSTLAVMSYCRSILQRDSLQHVCMDDILSMVGSAKSVCIQLACLGYVNRLQFLNLCLFFETLFSLFRSLLGNHQNVVKGLSS